MPRRVRCRICGRTHNWNENNICVRCKKNKKYTFEYEETIEITDQKDKDEDPKEDKVKVDPNAWIREILENLIDRRVSFFTKDGTHTVGNIKEIKKDFLILDMTHRPYESPEPVEVISNKDNVGIETFKKYFLRIDDIVGFGEAIP